MSRQRPMPCCSAASRRAARRAGISAMLAKLHAGLPDAVAAHSINNYCASGLSAIGQAITKVASGDATHVLAGGVESMSGAPFLGDRAGFYTNDELPPRARFVPPVLAADRLANAEGIGRADLDAVALASQQKAGVTENDALLQKVADRDRAAWQAKSASALKPQRNRWPPRLPAFGELQQQYAGALEDVTFEPLHSIAHAPPICDGAGLALIGGEGLGLSPRARVIAFAESGGDPAASLTAGLRGDGQGAGARAADACATWTASSSWKPLPSPSPSSTATATPIRRASTCQRRASGQGHPMGAKRCDPDLDPARRARCLQRSLRAGRTDRCDGGRRGDGGRAGRLDRSSLSRSDGEVAAEGLTEGQSRGRCWPPPPFASRTVPLSTASPQGGLAFAKADCAKGAIPLWAARAGLALRMIAPVPERA